MVRRILLFSLIALVWLLAVAIPVYAVSVTNALYVADIVAQNSGGAASNVSTVCPINTQALIDGKYIEEDILNTALQTSTGTDIPYMPGVGSNPWVFFMSSIGASEQKSYLFYAGGPDMQTGFYYFPASGGMITEDSASIELGDNFEVEQKGWIDTSVDVASWLSPTGYDDPDTAWTNEANAYDDSTTTYAYTTADIDATSWSPYLELTRTATSCIQVRVWADVAVTETDEIDIDAYYDSAWNDVYQGTFTAGQWIYKSLDGISEVTEVRARLYNGDSSARQGRIYEVDFGQPEDESLVSKEGGFRLYISGDESISASIYDYQGGSGTWTSPTSASGTGWSDTANTYDDNTGTYASYTISPKTFSEYLYLDTDLYSDRVRYYVTRENANVDTMYLDVYYDSGWHNLVSGVFTVGAWAEVGIGSVEHVTQARMKFYNNSVGSSYYVRVHEFDFRANDLLEAVTVTAEDISSGVHTVKATADGTNLKIYVDTVEEDSAALGGYSVPDNGNDWSCLTNGSMPYMEYHKITVGGTLKQHIVYERDTIFSDQSGNDNDATPTFPTTSSDPDVTATLQNFRPIDEAICTTGITETSPEMLTEIPDQPTEFYTEGEVEHLPGAELINDLLDAGGIPHDLFWIPACFGLAAVAVVLSYYPIRSMMFIAVIGWVVILFFALTGAIPLWPFFVYPIPAGAVLVSERVFGW